MYHCGITKCECTHTQGCEFGWIYGTETDRKVAKSRDGQTIVTEQKYEVVSPCPNCRPELYNIFATSRSRQELQERLRSRSVHTRLKDYEQTEEGRTRTL